jgi:hypothetical protein
MISQSIDLSSFFTLLTIRLGRHDCLQIWNQIFYGGLAVRVEKVQNDDDGQLNGVRRTLSMNAMMDRVSTKDEVPDAPLRW